MDVNTNNSNNMNTEALYNQCRNMMYYHAVARMRDGSEYDGVVQNVNPDSVDMLVGEDVIDRDDGDQYSDNRQYGYPRRYRRFRQRRFPLAQLLAMSVLPYPYYAPPYSYYPYNPY